MKQPYTPKRIRVWRLLSATLRGLASVLRVWPLWVVGICLAAPISPHLRWQYTYTPYGTHRIYHACTYLGVHGWVAYRKGQDCPLLTLIDRRQVTRPVDH